MVPYARQVGHAFSDFSDHSRRLRFRSLSWRGQKPTPVSQGTLRFIDRNIRNSEA
jgi:hypothetical protein